MKGNDKSRCVNLQEIFAKQYRLQWEAGGETRSRWPKEEWPWLLEVHCRLGVVYPFGGEVLAAFTDRPRIGAKLRVLPFILTSKGDEETVVTFHVDHAPAVLKLLRAYRRRSLSDVQRAHQGRFLVAARSQKVKNLCLVRGSRTPERTKEADTTQPLATSEFVASSAVWTLPDRTTGADQ